MAKDSRKDLCVTCRRKSKCPVPGWGVYQMDTDLKPEPGVKEFFEDCELPNVVLQIVTECPKYKKGGQGKDSIERIEKHAEETARECWRLHSKILKTHGAKENRESIVQTLFGMLFEEESEDLAFFTGYFRALGEGKRIFLKGNTGKNLCPREKQ